MTTLTVRSLFTRLFTIHYLHTVHTHTHQHKLSTVVADDCSIFNISHLSITRCISPSLDTRIDGLLYPRPHSRSTIAYFPGPYFQHTPASSPSFEKRGTWTHQSIITHCSARGPVLKINSHAGDTRSFSSSYARAPVCSSTQQLAWTVSSMARRHTVDFCISNALIVGDDGIGI